MFDEMLDGMNVRWNVRWKVRWKGSRAQAVVTGTGMSHTVGDADIEVLARE